MSEGPKPLALDPSRDGVALWIHVTPRARKPRLGGLHDGALRVAVAAPASDGKANAACRRALADALGLAQTDIDLDPGSKGRRKRVHLTGDPGVLGERLQMLAQGNGVG